MVKESKVIDNEIATVQDSAIEEVQETENVPEVKEGDLIETPLLIEREPFKKDGKQYFQYFIKGAIRGKEIKVGLMPPDKGGYQVLDIVFGDKKSAKLVKTPYEMTDDKTKKTISGYTYEALNTDEDGMIFKTKIKPSRPSDKSLLDMLLQIA